MSNHTLELTDSNFTETINNSEVPVMVDFWAPWCGPCRSLAPIVEELASDYTGKIAVAKVNTDDSPNIASQFNISSIPTLLFFKNGQVVKQVIGAHPKAKLEQQVQEVLAN
ncbi:MAG: thioredoxin [Candidatus Eisenbacteria bacterium]|uniref:Thioredoxin n=1 Tax=Eiseniibacteriota bacterium TaxID=2212470 RepID=A0A7Y2EEC8_UNCEI|nr:thioredoxin [Candidatus Eisenbacteria bacterium]